LTHSNLVEPISNKGIYYNIDTKGGQSGSSICVAEDKRKVVGIHKAYDSNKRLNLGTMITE
jgi:V8-like Glu-specific endopeptidase